MRSTRASGATRRRAASAAGLGAALPLARGAVQGARPLPKEVAAASVDSMARAYVAEKGAVSVSVAVSRGGETLVERARELSIP